MPSYEALLILRKLAKPGLAQALKRVALKIYDTNGILYGIENLGTRSLPYSISLEGRRHREGSYFLMKFDGPPKSIAVIKDECFRDIDIMKSGFVKIQASEQFECNLEEELKPPPYREDVKEMIAKGRKAYKYKFQPNTNLDYNPFRT